MKEFNRRQLLALGALFSAPIDAVFAGTVSADATQRPLLLSAASDGDDHHWVVGLRMNDTGLDTVFKNPVPERAHHIAVNTPRGFYIVHARRPGTWLMLGDLATGTLHTEVRVPADRHIFGHGIFAADGDLFYTTESDFNDMTGDSGRLVEWRVTGEGATAALERMREFPSYGVGPHELLLHPDGATLVIANGGIRTHPDHDRDNLNVDTMQPSLVYVDRRSGALLEQHYMPAEFHQSGIRHLDVNAEGLVAMGMQFEGEPFMDVPLLATHRRGDAELRLLKASPELQPQMQQYVGSVRFDTGGRFFAASCPKGNMLTFWDAESGDLVHSTRARDGCGVCAVQDGFVFSTGTGRVAHIDLATNAVNDLALHLESGITEHVFWDNHMSVAGALS